MAQIFKDSVIFFGELLQFDQEAVCDGWIDKA
jgi:hypothetical protein